MLTRSIDPEDFGPTFEETIFVIGKRICVVSAVAALSISALDLVNANAVTTVAAALHEGRLHANELPGRLLAGIHQISIYPDRSSVVVAIPRDGVADLPKVAALSRPAATLYDPAKQAFMPLASPKREEPKVALAKPEPVKPAPNVASEADTKLAKNSPAVAQLANSQHEDAVETAMLPPADSQRPGIFALASLPASMTITPTPAVAIKGDVKADARLADRQAVPPATDANAAPVQLASLDTGALPPVAVAPATMTITLPPLNMVPMPIPAPGVPPPSPAQRLKLEGKDYAKAERCLANAVYWESRSEPVRGQMAVAQVVMNRVFSPFYPNDVCSVVYQNANRHLACQFTFACDGKRKVINERGAWARANRIAKQTLDGQIYVAEVGKSTHYHAAYVHPYWAREMRRLAHYGLHSFYRPYAWGNGADMPVWGKKAMAKTAMAKADTKKK